MEDNSAGMGCFTVYLKLRYLGSPWRSRRTFGQEGEKIMGKILIYLWMIFSIIVIGKAYYDTAKDVIEWIRKKIKIKEEKKEDVESTV